MNPPITLLGAGRASLDPTKFQLPRVTAKGEPRGKVALERLETLWINTGSLCNIPCANCYIESSPTNDRLAFFTRAEAETLYAEIAALRLAVREIGFTGGEPFLNPDLLAMAKAALACDFSVLILTNAMTPMQRPASRRGLLALKEANGDRLGLRVSLDHYSREHHEEERGQGTWAAATAGIDWLTANGLRTAIAGRTRWGEDEVAMRAGYTALFEARGWPIDAHDRDQLVLFPEMDERADVTEITEDCWDRFGKRPQDLMCATSRMAVRRKGADRPALVPCTLLPYDPAFEMGSTLAEMLTADAGNFDCGAVWLNHPHCARFCFLGGGSCSGRRPSGSVG